ncbi:MAG TPA: cytochrome c, partial [Acidobacteriota bacterium]|nr:cytochrome c [Acidobacteriota bacterium]
GYSGKGDGTSATSFDPPPRDYTDAEIMNAITDLTLAETIRFGGIDRGFPNMPAFPHVNHDELVALVAYVRSLSRPGLASVQIGTVE